jgi:predicted metal-binding protein
MSGCASLVRADGFRPCLAEAVATAVYMCVHEHLREGPKCQWHLDNPGSCNECRTCADPHLCILRELERTT